MWHAGANLCVERTVVFVCATAGSSCTWQIQLVEHPRIVFWLCGMACLFVLFQGCHGIGCWLDHMAG